MRTLFLVFSLIFFLVACNGPSKITQKGLAYAKLGDAMPAKGTETLAGLPARDTLYDEGGFQWRALILTAGAEEIFIEEDFGKQGLINRIRVESPSLTVGKKKYVGMSWLDLSKLGKKWDAFYLANYGVWDVISQSQNRIHYLLEEKRDTSIIDLDADVRNILDEAKVKAIVIM